LLIRQFRRCDSHHNTHIITVSFPFTKPTKCPYDVHNSILFGHSDMFRHYCAILREFLHQVLKLVKIYNIRNICVCSTSRSEIQFARCELYCEMLQPQTLRMSYTMFSLVLKLGVRTSIKRHCSVETFRSAQIPHHWVRCMSI